MAIDQKLPGSDGVLRTPKWMTKAQKKLWKKAVNSAPAGLLVSMDFGIIEVWTIAADTWQRAAEMNNKAELIEPTGVKGYVQQNPYISIMNKQALIMVKCQAEMGYTPAARTRLMRLDGAKVPAGSKPGAPPKQGSAGEVLTREPLGKKAAADEAAKTSQQGSGWADVLPNHGTQQ